MKTLMLFATAASALTLGGCADEFGLGLGSGGYGNGYSDYGYSDGYSGYGADNQCIAYDRYGRAYYTCNSYYGGYGYSRDLPIERYLRDAKLCTIGEGTSDRSRIVVNDCRALNAHPAIAHRSRVRVNGGAMPINAKAITAVCETEGTE